MDDLGDSLRADLMSEVVGMELRGLTVFNNMSISTLHRIAGKSRAGRGAEEKTGKRGALSQDMC